MNKFVIRVTFYFLESQSHYIQYYELNEINEHSLIQTFKKDNKNYKHLSIKILSYQKMTYKELYQFNVGAYKKLFPDNVKVMTFKAPNETYFDVDKPIKSNQHEFNYIRYMEDKGFKHVGTVNKIYDHNLNE